MYELDYGKKGYEMLFYDQDMVVGEQCFYLDGVLIYDLLNFIEISYGIWKLGLGNY